MKPFLLSLVCAAVLLIGASPVAAQTPRPERPYRGLFGGGVGDAEQLLTLSVSLGGGYDDNVLADPGGALGPIDPRVSQRGSFGYLGGNLNYSLTRRRVSLGASAVTSSRYAPDLATQFVGAHTGSAGMFVRVAERTHVRVNQTVARQPFHTINTFPQLFTPDLGQIQPPSQERGTLLEDYLTYTTRGELAHSVSRRGSLSFTYGYHLSDFADGNHQFVMHTAGGHFGQELTRGLRLRVGYAYAEGQYSELEEALRVRQHTLDIGVDFSRALSFSRRTTVSFNTGSTALVDGNQTHYRLTGTAHLRHEIGRTWTLAAAYNRNVEFVETLREPFFGDSITAGVSGMLNRRLQFYSSVGASLGHVGFSSEANSFDTYTGTSGLNFGLTRHVALGVNYSYYQYRFERAVLLPSRLSREMDRQSVRAYISLWAPLFYRMRKPDVTR